MDALTTVLHQLRLEGSFYARSELGAPWGLAFAATDGPSFHVVVKGHCWLRLGAERILLSAGDLTLLPYGRDHSLGDAPDGPATPLSALPSKRIGNNVAMLQHGGNGKRTLLVCGGIWFAGAETHPLLGVLPEVIVLRRGDGEEWLGATLALVGDEALASRPGGYAVLTRLMDLLVIQALRAWACGGEGWAYWLGALADVQIGQALTLIHGRPAEPWTVAALATAVHLSRSVFAERFNRLVGTPPAAYLTRWRMHLAGVWLLENRSGLDELSLQVGYGSEAAFSRAFSRHFSISPSAFRRLQGTPGQLMPPYERSSKDALEPKGQQTP